VSITTPASPKKVLLVLPEAFDCAGGIQMFCRALCLAAGRWAKANDATVSALVLNDRDAPDPRYVNGGFASYAVAGKSKTKLIRQYLKQLRSTQYDWIIFGHVSLSPLALVAKRFNPKAKIGMAAYGIDVSRSLSKLERQALKQTDVVLAISEYTKREVAKHQAIPANRITIFPCTLDPYWDISPYEPAKQQELPVILTVARLTKEDSYKGIDNVIRSLPTIVREAGPVEYRVVGSGDDLPRLRNLASEVGVAKYVNFVGSVADEELRKHYERCSLFVMPSNNEGFGIVFLEAMAYGKPVIGGAHGGTPTVVKDGETGFLVENDDLEEIARSITRLLQDEKLREKFGRAGHERLLNEFTFARFERNLQTVLR
jgi:phosphatidyl-myo-inositol dimannoside synthase